METTLNRAAGLASTASPFEALRTRYRQYQTYRQTIRELSSLSDRGLADLGLNRSMIKALAREAAYGA